MVTKQVCFDFVRFSVTFCVCKHS